MNKLIRELNDGRGKPIESLSVCLLLLSSPKSYDNILTTLETLAEDHLTLNFSKGKLLDKELICTSNKIETEHKLGTTF